MIRQCELSTSATVTPLAYSTWRVRHRPISPWRIWRRLGCWYLANDPTMLDHARILLPTVGNLTMNERERAHCSALEQAVMGARSAAASLLDRHLMRYPFDLVAHQAVTLLDGYLGRFRWVRDRTARALPFWSKNMPGYATILAFHGFGLEEAGDYARAEDEFACGGRTGTA